MRRALMAAGLVVLALLSAQPAWAAPTTQVVQGDAKYAALDLLYASLPAERLRTAPRASPTVKAGRRPTSPASSASSVPSSTSSDRGWRRARSPR